jgi:hypothetical protein
MVYIFVACRALRTFGELSRIAEATCLNSQSLCDFAALREIFRHLSCAGAAILLTARTAVGANVSTYSFMFVVSV